MQPAVPVLTSALAVALGSERLSLRRRDGWAKLAGATLCVAGALVTGAWARARPRCKPRPVRRNRRVMRGRHTRAPLHLSAHAVHLLSSSAALLTAPLAAERGTPGSSSFSRGLACLLGNCASLAAYLTLQEWLLLRYPAPMRVTLLSYAFGTAALVLALLATGGAAVWRLPKHALGAVVYAGVVASGANYVALAWANTQLGPAMLSLYLPLQPLAAALLSRVAFGTRVGGAVLGGGALIAAGLGAVAWGRSAGKRLDERMEEKASFLARLEEAGGGEAGHSYVRKSASLRLIDAEAGAPGNAAAGAPERGDHPGRGGDPKAGI